MGRYHLRKQERWHRVEIIQALLEIGLGRLGSWSGADLLLESQRADWQQKDWELTLRGYGYEQEMHVHQRGACWSQAMPGQKSSLEHPPVGALEGHLQLGNPRLSDQRVGVRPQVGIR